MPLWYHPPPVLVGEGAPAAPGCPVNSPLYYHPPPVCIDPSGDAAVPLSGTAPPTGRVMSPRAQASNSPARTAPGCEFSGLPPPVMPGMHHAPYQGGILGYPHGSYGGSHATEDFNPSMAPAPAGIHPPAGYPIQPPQNPYAAPPMPSSCPGELSGPPRFGSAGTTSPRRFGERVYYYDDKTKEIHIADPGSCAQLEQPNPPPQPNLPHTNLAHKNRPYYVDENSGHKITIFPNTHFTQRKSHHLELTRDNGGEFEVKLWRGGEDHRCEKKVRVVSGPSGGDNVDINLGECQICDNHERESDEVEKQRLHGLAKEKERRAKQLEEHKLKERIREEEYAKIKADEKLKLEIRKELEREDAQRQEVAQIEKLQAEKRTKRLEAERRVAAERERERVRREVDIELRLNKAHIAKLEAEKEHQMHLENMVQEETTQRELTMEVEKRRKEQLASMEEQRRRLEDRAKEEAKQQEFKAQVERERIRREVDVELKRREQAYLAEIEAEKKKKEEGERLKEEARNLEFAVEMERRSVANLAAEDKRKAEEHKRAGVEAHKRKLDEERRLMIDEINKKRAEEDRVRRREWENVRAMEMHRMREEIRKELNEKESQRIKDERIKSETLRIQQLETDRIGPDEQVRIQVHAGREGLRRELRKELEKEEEDRILRLQIEATATLKAKTEMEALAREQARTRFLAEAQERQRIEDQIKHEEVTKKLQSQQVKATMRKQAQVQEIELEKERFNKRLEEATRAATMAAAIVKENELRRIIRAEIEEDIRKSRVQDEVKIVEELELTSRSPHRERVQLQWETDCGDRFEQWIGEGGKIE